MTDKKSWGSTVAGWFIERDDDASAPGAPEEMSADEAEALIRAASGGPPAATEAYTAPSPTQTVFQSAPPPPTGGQVDFEAVFNAAGVDTEERARVARTVELLKSLPAGTDAGVKKQIVEASLKAFGVPIEKIIEAAVEEIQALDGYTRNAATDNETLMQESDARIKQYEEEIRNIRAIMQQSVTELQAVIKVCNDKKLEVQQVLEFFGQAKVAQVVKDSPKLHDPAAPANPPAS
ncbi:MAG TPA: hypothetical protein VE775_02685 [Pyrinomonadaceae bacterium]|jgi:hypothetical protein|nr:hypothetical protein [Pyrinomonadaceae bacterium]